MIDLNLYPKNRPGVIKYTSIYLKKDKSLITYNDVEIFHNWISDRLNVDNLTPNEIKNLLGIEHTNFGMFIKQGMNIQLKNLSNALHNHAKKTGRTVTDIKKIYWNSCKFIFDPFKYPLITGYELLTQYSFYHPIGNPNGITMDHMISIKFGYDNQIDSKIISHPANCHIMLAKDNFSKNNSSSITIEDLTNRINAWDKNEQLPYAGRIKIGLIKSESHRANLAKANKNLRTYTNGYINIRQHQNLPIPEGFKSGMTRRINMKINNISEKN